MDLIKLGFIPSPASTPIYPVWKQNTETDAAPYSESFMIHGLQQMEK